MEEAINQFLSFLSQERALSDNTIVAYRNDLDQFLSYVRNQPLGLPASPAPAAWSGVQPAHVNGYISFLQERSYADATIARKLVSLKSFFVYLKERGFAVANPADGIPSMGIKRSLPKTITTQEVEALLSQSVDNKSADAARDKAMLSLLYTTGMRVTELVRLDLADLYLNETELYVMCIGRGGRPRAITILPQALGPLQDYLSWARDRLARSSSGQALFLNQRGDRLTRQGFWLILKGYAKEAKLDASITPHTLRHSFAAHMLKSGKLSLPALQRTLGHSSITSTQIYAQVADESKV